MKNMEAEYDNSGRVENSSKLLSDYIEHAGQFRSRAAKFADFDQSYGPNIRNKLDLFWPGTNAPDKTAPIVMFIHGGYWQRLDRAAFSHMALGLNAKGVAVAIPSYTLCPDINISGIIDEIRRACIVLWKTYGRNITVCGHSAGGHLAACMLATNWNRIHNSLPINLVESALSISGVFDLAPLLETSHNNALKLTKEEAKTASPYNWIIEHDLRFDAWVGENESSEFIRQSSSQAQRWRMMGANTRYHEIPGANHFTAIEPLTDANSLMVKRLLELMQPVQATTLDNLNIPAHNPLPADPRAANQTTTPTAAQKTEAKAQPPVPKPPVTLSPISPPPSSQSVQKQEPPKVIIPEVQAKTMPPEQAPAPKPEVKSEAKVSDYKQASTPASPAATPTTPNPAAGVKIVKAGIAPKKAEVVKSALQKIAPKPQPEVPKDAAQNKSDAKIKKNDTPAKPDEARKEPKTENTPKAVTKTAAPHEGKADPKSQPKQDTKTETKAGTASKTPPLPEKTARPSTEVKPKSSQENAPKPKTKTAKTPEPKVKTEPKTDDATEAKPNTKDQTGKNETAKTSNDQNISFDGPAKDSDNLILINNINGKIQSRLNELGFSTFLQIAELSLTQQEMIEDILGFDGQIEQEHWITQARHLIARKQLASEN